MAPFEEQQNLTISVAKIVLSQTVIVPSHTYDFFIGEIFVI